MDDASTKSTGVFPQLTHWFAAITYFCVAGWPLQSAVKNRLIGSSVQVSSLELPLSLFAAAVQVLATGS